MNKIEIKLAILIILCGLTACGDYLNVVPDNVPTIDYAFRNKLEAQKFLYTCYSYRPAIGDLRGDPAMAGADETWQRYVIGNGSLWPTWESSYIARGFQNPNAPYYGYNNWNFLWTGIRDCNIFLENIDHVDQMPDYEKKRWTCEVKFLKAYYHYYLFKSYGPIPIMDVSLPVTSDVSEFKVYRQPVDSVVRYISNLFMESVADLPNAGDVIEGSEAGRVDKLAALSMRAELLLFAASPLFNGNTDYATMMDKQGVQLFSQDYDRNKWKLAADACKEAIDACHAQGKALYNLVDPLLTTASDTFKLQTTYRQAICDRWNKELIWGSTNFDAGYLIKNATPRLVRLEPQILDNVTGEWAPTLKMVGKYYSAHGVPIEEDIDWRSNGWYENRYKIRPEPSSDNEGYYVKEGERTVYLHYSREPRFYASVGFDKGIYFGSGYTNFSTDVKYTDFLNFQVSGWQGGSGFSATGYSAKKMHSFKDSQKANGTTFEYYPFPIMRLANLYLMYAEALNEFGGPTEEVFTYIDQVRARAGLAGVKASWTQYSNNPGKPNSTDGLREIIQRERTIELAFEGKRFWDIRRWKQIDVMNEQPQGWSILGETAEDFYKVAPMAKVPVEFSVKDYLWPIRVGELVVNRNLVQNYGW